jgi:hypothetical protein
MMQLGTEGGLIRGMLQARRRGRRAFDFSRSLGNSFAPLASLGWQVHVVEVSREELAADLPGYVARLLGSILVATAAALPIPARDPRSPPDHLPLPAEEPRPENGA